MKKCTSEIDNLFKEYEMLTQEIKERVGRSDKIIGFGITITGIGISYGIKERLPEIMLAVPIIFIGIMLYSVFNTTIVLTLGGTKKCLAERINLLTCKQILIWETISHSLIHRCTAVKLLNVYYFIFLIVTIYLGIRCAYFEYSTLVIYIYSVLLLALNIGLAVSIKIMTKAFEKAYNLSSILLSE